MEKIFIFVFCLATTLTVSAQASGDKQKKVEGIRKHYQSVKENIKYRQEAQLPPDDLVATANYMAPGAGPIIDTTHYFYGGDWDENVGMFICKPYFITRSYNVGDVKFYQELLIDQDENLEFFYMKSGQNEVRYYYSNNELIHKIIKGDEELWDEFTPLRLANDLISAFNPLFNRDY